MRVVILGNSGSGKSTLAARLARESGCPSLDLDTIYWEADQPAVARPLAEAVADVLAFCARNDSWVVEGCYERLVEPVLALGPELIFLDPGVERCVSNCTARPWEPHKYASKQLQDERLHALLDWVRDYYARSGELSYAAHCALYERYAGPKSRRVSASP